MSTSNVVRLLPSGTVDASFVASPVLPVRLISSLAVPPNGRVLWGGTFGAPGRSTLQGTQRLLDAGQANISYNPANGPASYVHRLLMQPDGAIVAGGVFTTVGSRPLIDLTRLLDTTVLSAQSGRTASVLTAWPVPTRGVLHVATEEGAQPKEWLQTASRCRDWRTGHRQPEVLAAVCGFLGLSREDG